MKIVQKIQCTHKKLIHVSCNCLEMLNEIFWESRGMVWQELHFRFFLKHFCWVLPVMVRHLAWLWRPSPLRSLGSPSPSERGLWGREGEAVWPLPHRSSWSAFFVSGGSAAWSLSRTQPWQLRVEVNPFEIVGCPGNFLFKNIVSGLFGKMLNDLRLNFTVIFNSFTS